MKLVKPVLLVVSAFASIVIVFLIIVLFLFYYLFILSDWEECFDPLQCYEQTCGSTMTPVEIERINVSNNRSVVLYYMDCKAWYDRTVPIHYEVIEANEVVIPMTYIDFYELSYVDQLAFEVVYAEEASLVGVYDTNNPFAILIDFKSAESWPDHSRIKAENLIERLQRENSLLAIPGFPPTVTPVFTSTPAKPTPTSTLVVQPTYYTPQARSLE